jgi:hypothetical protein
MACRRAERAFSDRWTSLTTKPVSLRYWVALTDALRTEMFRREVLGESIALRPGVIRL